ncbi:MAG: cysteine-rich CWC family protein [Anaerolineae bacterium]|nr:cysteine-rich CWC family protein [Anaerolineae bacterium]
MDASNMSGGPHTCPRCGSAFTCGLQAKEATCWCSAYPHVITAGKASRKGCYCPNCLGEIVKSIQQQSERIEEKQ